MNDHSAHTHVKAESEPRGRLATFGRFWQWLINWPINVQEETEEHELLHFLPGKVLLHIERPNNPAALTDESLAEELRDFLSPKKEPKEQEEEDAKFPWKKKLLPLNPERIITFPAKENRRSVLSIVPLRMMDPKASTEELETLLMDIAASLKAGKLTIRGQTTLNSVSPDWLVGSSGHGAPHPPSPGSWPLQAPTPNSDQQKIWLIQDKPNQKTTGLPLDEGQGDGVDIAILDTAPHEVSRKEAFGKWEGKPLIDNLLGPDAKLTVHNGIYADVALADYSVVGHRYRMSDHGLFVAGIINGIAPKADLHLFQAFTAFGSGSCESIAGGIKQILQMKKEGRTLLVSCSFTLNLDDYNSVHSAQIKEMRKLFEEMFKQLTDNNDILVIAAAGNNIDQPGRPPTDYPAAFEKVLGVGALPKASSIAPSEFNAASYSKLCDDKNKSEGFMVFGGEPGEGNGVHSIYISEFPVYAEGCLSYLWRKLTGTGLDHWKGPGHLPPNPRAFGLNRIRYEEPEDPYAWWAGTSFAAPHITGIVANWCSQPKESKERDSPGHSSINIDNVKDALQKRSQSKTTVDKKEQVILVIQGPLPQ